MPVKRFNLSKKVNKDISKLPLRIQNKIDKAFDGLKLDPLLGVKLHGELGDYYKFRVGDYRIIYSFNSSTATLEIIRVEHRQGVYK